METIVLGGGCFWCIEAVFAGIRGVESATSGYAGGDEPDPSYYDVASGSTGHAEVVEVKFDPSVVALRDLLTIFFTLHDPTTLNRQGADVGTQYRSAIFYSDEVQRDVALEVMQEIADAGIWDDPIVTELRPLEAFYEAEDEHQRYFEKHGNNAYCQIVIAPKVAKLRSEFYAKLK